MRLDLAEKLISDTDTPVCDIPGRVGVASLPHFMTFFRRTGLTRLLWLFPEVPDAADDDGDDNAEENAG